MASRRKFITFFMLFVFGMLFLKNLLPPTESPESCDEIGHIHDYHRPNFSGSDRIQTATETGHRLDDCHSSQSIFGISVLPQPPVLITGSFFEVTKKISSLPDKIYKNPFLEPPRKPPLPQFA